MEEVLWFRFHQPIQLTLLIVLDGNAHVNSSFYPNATDTQDKYFSLAHVIDVLRSWSTPAAETKLILAHRQTDSNPIESGLPFNADYASQSNFVFSDNTLRGVHEVWLLGYNGADWNYYFLSDPQDPTDLTSSPELQALCRFMQNGGRVFATGDHQDLGQALCGSIPRVRSMRKWFLQPGDTTDPKAYGANWLNRVTDGTKLNNPCDPPSSGYHRLDRVQKGRTWTEVSDPEDGTKKIPLYDFDNQSDDIPQRLIFPTDPPHYLFQGKNGPVDVLPDHMHEGEIIRPQDYGLVNDALRGSPRYNWSTGDFVTSFDEYPANPKSGTRPLPEIVAFGSVIRHKVTTELCDDIHAIAPNPSEDDGFSLMQAQPQFGVVGIYNGVEAGGRKPCCEFVISPSLQHQPDGRPCHPVNSSSQIAQV